MLINLLDYKRSKINREHHKKLTNLAYEVRDADKVLVGMFAKFLKGFEDLDKEAKTKEFVFLLVKRAAIIAANVGVREEDMLKRWRAYYKAGRRS